MLVVLNYDKAGAKVARMERGNGRILCRFDAYSRRWRLEPGAVRDGLEDKAFTAARCAAYVLGQTDFSPAVHAPELGIKVDNRWAEYWD